MTSASPNPRPRGDRDEAPIVGEVALRTWWRVLLVSLAGAWSALVVGPPMTLAQTRSDTLLVSRRAAVDTALARNPTLVVAREQIEQARARVVQATAFPDPSVSAATTLSGPASSVGTTLGLGLTLPFPQKFHLQGEVSGADLKAAEFAYLQLRQQTASQTAQAYDSLLVALAHRADLTEGRRLAADFLEKTEARFEGGTAAKLDVLKAKVELAAAENALIGNQRDIGNAGANLNRLLGRPLGSTVIASDSLDVPAELPELDRLLTRAQTARPELDGLRSQQAGARAATTLASQYWMPDLSLGVSKNIFPDTPNSYSGSIGFTVPLFFWNHERGEVAEARHHQRQLDAAYRDLSAQVDQDVRVSYANAGAAFKQARYLRDELLPEARRAYEVARISYGLGGSSALDVLDARRTLLDAESQYADALGAANDARADLERAVGAPLETASSGETHDR